MFFAEPVLFELAVLPRVKKFIGVKLQDAQGRSHPMLAAPEALGPGLMLWAMAQSKKVHVFSSFKSRPGYAQRAPCGRHYDPAECTAQIGVGIQEFHPTRHQMLLSHVELLVFSNMVDHMIQNELVQLCTSSPDRPPMSHIKAFCDRYDFSEEDLSEAALKQMFLRYRKGIGAHGFAPEVTRNFAFVALSRLAA